MNRAVERLLEQPLVYRLWQSTHEAQKFAPILAHNDVSRARRVLDVGCGPGMNTGLFARSDYLGIDINPKYIESARRRFNRNFVVGDATTFTVPSGEGFDFILVNSFLHHIANPLARRVLSHLATLLTPDGHLHSIEVIMPQRPGLPRALARWDRGKFCRSVEEWRGNFTEFFDPVVFERFAVRLLGVACWELVYFKGRARG